MSEAPSDEKNKQGRQTIRERAMELQRECIRRLSAGEEAHAVMATLRERYKTSRSLASKASAIRRAYDGAHDVDGYELARRMRDMCATSRDDPSRKTTVVQQVEELVRSYGRASWTPSGDDALDVLVVEQAHALLPRNVRDLRINDNEIRANKRWKRDRLLQKHHCAASIDADVLLDTAVEILQFFDSKKRRSNRKHGMYDLVLALLIVTGRRTCEILNGRSTFVPTDDASASYACRFCGQLKTRNGRGERSEYTIPVLCDVALVVGGIATLRSMQPADVCTMSNRDVSSKYQSGLGQHMRTGWRRALFADVTKVHVLRGVYACCVHRMFAWGAWTLPAVVMRVLGHVSPEESLAYTALQVSVDKHADICLGNAREMGLQEEDAVGCEAKDSSVSDDNSHASSSSA